MEAVTEWWVEREGRKTQPLLLKFPLEYKKIARAALVRIAKNDLVALLYKIITALMKNRSW